MSGAGENCAGCAFWRRQRAEQGTCHRHAPRPSYREQQVAHWPETRPTQVCGEHVPIGIRTATTCTNCRFWKRPELGMSPLNKGDMFQAWWEKAGACVRMAPSPIGDPAPRAVWRATHNDDFCAEGVPREPNSPH